MEQHILVGLPGNSGLFLHIPDPGWARFLPCSLTSLKVTASVVDIASRVTLSQTFANEHATIPYEAVYRFPLLESGAVCAFHMDCNGHKITGHVEGREDAVKTYETAKSQGKTAGLLLHHEPDIFQVKVGNVPPKATVTITLTYIAPLKQDTETNSVRFTLPTVIAPRYGQPADGAFSNVSSSKPRFEFSLDAKMTSQVISVSSPSHPITMSLTDPASAQITLSNVSPALDKDIVVLITTKDWQEPHCVIETHPTLSTKCAMLNLVPKFNLPRVPTEVIFIIDRSGSMVDKVGTLKQALQIFLKSLPASPQIYFNICSFGSRHDFLFTNGKSRKYDSETLQKAETYVSKVDASYGGTEILTPLLVCMANRRTDCQTSIILLTDGEVYNTSSIIGAIAKERSKHPLSPLRVFSLGIGNSVSHHLVEGIAHAGGGYSQLVLEQERLDKKVVRMLASGLQSPIHNICLTWPGKPENKDMHYRLVSEDDPTDAFVMVDRKPTSSTFFDKNADDADSMHNEPPPQPPKRSLEAPKIQQIPETNPSLYNISRHIMFVLFPPGMTTPASLTLQGSTPDGTSLSMEIPVSAVISSDNDQPMIHTMAARSLLSELEESRLAIQAQHPDGNDLADAVKKEGIRIGVAHNLASRWTAFVAVDEENQSVVTDDSRREPQRDVPISFKPSSPFVGSPVFTGSFPSVPTGSPSAGISNPFSTPSAHHAFTPFGAVQSAPGARSGIGVFGAFGATATSSKKPKESWSAFGSSAFGSSNDSKSSSSGFGSSSPLAQLSIGRYQPPPPPAVVSQGSQDEQNFRFIVAHQTSVGLFPPINSLIQRLGFDSLDAALVTLPQHLKKLGNQVSLDVWITALVCAFLEQKLPQEKDAWELIVEKAWAYVVAQVGDSGTRELKTIAAAAITSM
jgi:Vault protein inter-alpha-trypsin domain/von Willebrand factor type A domain